MAEKVKVAESDTEEDPRRVRHLKQVERRAKFLARLTPHQRKVRDNHIAWVKWWRKKYKQLVEDIIKNKKFIRRDGHNNLLTLKYNMRRLHQQQNEARMMLLARAAGKVDYQMMVEAKPKSMEAVE